jgi:hypothetical protein
VVEARFGPTIKALFHCVSPKHQKYQTPAIGVIQHHLLRLVADHASAQTAA